jgi:hypothetical protein
MRLIIKYTVGNGCSWHCDITVPVVYASAEAFLVDFEDVVFERHAITADPTGGWGESEFSLGGQAFDWTDFFIDEQYHAPEVMTIDEWFKSAGVE